VRILPFLYVGIVALVSTSAITGAASGARNSGGVGYVDLSHLVRANSLYPELTHYDKAIAALQSTQATWSERDRAREIAHARAALAHAFGTASNALAQTSRRSGAYAARERDALQSLLSLPTPTSAAAGPQRFAANEQQTFAVLQQHEDAGFLQYRNDLAREERREIARVDRQLQRRVRDAYDQRLMQMQESEARRALTLSRRYAFRSLMLRVRARDTFHDQTDRGRQLSALNSMNRREDANLAALRVRDHIVLAAYRTKLVDDTTRRRSHIVAQIQRRMAANLRARETALRVAQSQHMTLPTVPQGTPLQVSSELHSLRSSSAKTISNEISSTRFALGAARSEMNARLTQLRAVDATSTRALRTQIVRLQRERRAVLHEIVAWIEQDARAVGRSHGIGTIRTSPTSGAVDLTAAVAARMSRDQALTQ
jgi:hypothetical protein